MAEKAEFISEIKALLIDLLNLQHLDPADLTADTRLHDDLNLDSIDILELVVGIENKYGFRIENSEKGKEIFKSLGSLADFILAQQATG